MTSGDTVPDDTDATGGPKRQVPVVTAGLMIAAAVSTLVLFVGIIPNLDVLGIGVGNLFFSFPPALFVCGAVAAPFHGSVTLGSRTAWCAVSASLAVFCVPAMYMAAVLIFGP